MVGRKVVYGSGASAVVSPFNAHPVLSRSVIGDGIVLPGLRLAVFGAAQLVPGVVGQTVAVLILAYPDDTRLG